MKSVLALEASAGSGKTFALSVRYIALLFLGANPSSIVALTFTKKAANEMRERIYETILHVETKEAEFDAICALTNKNKEEILATRKEVLRLFLESPLHVETIDAFFGKVLRKFSLHLGLMPDFQTINLLLSSDLEKEFTAKVKKDKNVLQTLVKLMVNNQMNFAKLFSLFEILYEKNVSLCSKKEDIKFPSGETVLQKVGEIVQFLESKKASARAIKVFNVSSVEELTKKSFWQKESLEYWDYKKIYESTLDELFLELKDCYRDYCDSKEVYILKHLNALYSAYEEVRFQKTKKQNELTFSDVTKYLHTLLLGSVSNDFLYFRLDSQIEHLLIDEFQDTNIMQVEILKPIIEEIVAGVGTSSDKSFFYVGDTKQSIYRFRGGTKGLFEVVAQEFHVSKEALDTNYRSDGIVVNFVNEIFSKVIDGYINQKVQNKKQALGYICVKSYDEVIQGVKEGVSRLLESGVNQDDIALLCYTNSDALMIKESLLEWKNDLNISTHSTKNIFDTQEISAIVECLKFCYFGKKVYEKNTLVLIGRSFEEHLGEIVLNFKEPLVKNIIKIVRFLDLDGTSKDILQLVEAVTLYESVEEFLFDVETLEINSLTKEAKGIKVLTIHKSKGLEYPYVIVADKLGGQNNQKEMFIYEFEQEKLKNLHVRMQNREYVDNLYSKLKEEEAQKEQDDRVNAQYVAFTRARNGLFVVQKNKSTTFEVLGLEEREEGKIVPIQQETDTNLKLLKEFNFIECYGLQNSPKNEDDNSYMYSNIYFGSAMHYCLEMMMRFDQNALQNAFESMKNRYGIYLEKEECEDIYARILMLLQDTTFCSLVKNAKVYKEQALLFEGQKRQLDLLLEHEKKLIIVDYKSSQKTNEKNIEQVVGYKKALEAMQQKEVEAWLFYLQKEGIKTIKV